MFIKKINNLKKLQKIFVIFLVTLIFSNNLFGLSYIYNIDKKVSNESSIAVINNINPTFSFKSKSQVLMEPITGNVIYANNENEKILPASVTKVMTLLLTMEAIESGKLKYTDKIICSAKASKMGGSQIWFKENEELTVDEALKAICVVSANDVTVAMAEHLGGNEENFVKQMNEKAKLLGMNNTNFMNPHGIDEDNHYTSAMDIAIMSRTLINEHPDILKYTSIWMDTLRNGTFNLSSTNKLIRFYDGANGLKTGSTSKALFNLSATATREGTTFIAVVCTAPTGDIRNEEVKQLLDFGFSNFKIQNICDKNTIIDKIEINKSLNNSQDVIIKDKINILIEKGKEIETKNEIIYNENIIAPINKEKSIGKIIITNIKDGNILTEKEIYLSRDILKSSVKDYYKYLIKKIIKLT
ncbi:MAG: D-alanyl-D-alanine carboxypeptidase family protein [Clostridia bacterium]